MTLRNPRNRKKYSIEIVAETNLRLIPGVSAVQAMKLITVNKENFVAHITGKSDKVEPLTKEKLKQQHTNVFAGLGLGLGSTSETWSHHSSYNKN